MRPSRRVLASFKKKRARKILKRSAVLSCVLFSIFLCFVVLAAWFSGYGRFLIGDVVVSGNEVIDDGDIRNTVLKEIDGKYMFLFHKDNIFIFPKKSIQNSLELKFPRIKSIEIHRDTLREINIKIVERAPMYLWCGYFYDGIDEKADGFDEASDRSKNCYFTDDYGYIYAQAPHFSGHVFFELYGEPKLKDSMEDGGIIRSYFLPETEFMELMNFKDAIDTAGVPVSGFAIDEKENYTFILDSGCKIYFNRDQDFGILLDNLNSVAGEINIGGELEYIDLRFGNKVFFKEL